MTWTATKQFLLSLLNIKMYCFLISKYFFYSSYLFNFEPFFFFSFIKIWFHKPSIFFAALNQIVLKLLEIPFFTNLNALDFYFFFFFLAFFLFIKITFFRIFFYEIIYVSKVKINEKKKSWKIEKGKVDCFRNFFKMSFWFSEKHSIQLIRQPKQNFIMTRKRRKKPLKYKSTVKILN